MRHDPSQTWIDHDQVLAARLEQHPGSSSIVLANDLAAETGLPLGTAAAIVEDYTFRKAIDTRAADWKAVRPALMQYLRVMGGLTASICVGHLMALFLLPPMRTIIRTAGFVLGTVITVTTLVRQAGRGTEAMTSQLDERSQKAGNSRVFA
ncbi:hypothetical protein [Paludisphaera borealis]|uniref:Uncharacterized protein n=1 Tax=Paludisphaera borealis TaxID=1387353 RepID=A0A1U7CYK2_9BACT|nr:hypothetical protein [Paludisphaera borealis]APW63968.1 hypothetical protein BSF38_05556 [Paludisphaera borealis]